MPLHSWPDRSARALHLQSGDARLRADKSADPPYTPTDAAFGADLPDRIVQLMTNARYASIVVRGDSDRTVFLPEIISLHTRRELSEIDGIGRASIARIQTWLAQQGRRLRRPGESIDSVICHFGVRRKELHPHKRPLLPAIAQQPDATLAPALQNSDSKADATL